MALPEQQRTPIPYVVHGSFRRHLDEIQAAITVLDETGMATAIAPHDCTAAAEQDGFVLLSGEEGEDPRHIEGKYLQKVLSLRALGGFSLWVNPEGYIGTSAAYEYGVAQACGIPAFFIEEPRDVPFYVPPSSIKRPTDIAAHIQRHSAIPDITPTRDSLAQTWEQLAFPVASVAVGGIVRFRNRLLLVEDGRWQDSQLTVPGTTVRSRETRNGALQRACTEKFGIDPNDVQPFRTSFMIDGSGYGKPIRELVFDDRLINVPSDHLTLRSGLVANWASPDEANELIAEGQIEPNAAALLATYLEASY